MQKSVAVLASGEGTNLEAIIDYGIEVTVIVCDRECNAIKLAKKRGIVNVVFNKDQYKNSFGGDWRKYLSIEVRDYLLFKNIELVVAAGWRTIFDKEFFEGHNMVVINTHPSLLPKYRGPGKKAIEQALANKDKKSGCTFHYMTLEVDAGDIIRQIKVPVFPSDTFESLQKRIKNAENLCYPEIVSKLAGV
jgi:phosphoribosylglycinamide formyltransferase-1